MEVISFQIALIVPYNLVQSQHGNAIRVMNFVEFLSRKRHNLFILMYDQFNKRQILDGSNIKNYFSSVNPWILAASFLSKYLFKAYTFDLWCTYYTPSYFHKRKFKHLLSTEEIDIIQCENAWTIPQTLPLARSRKIPIISTLHDVLSERVRQVCKTLHTSEFIAQKLIEKTQEFEIKAVNSTDLSACVSEEDRKRFIELGVNPEKLTVIPNGVNTKKICPMEKDTSLIEELSLNKAKPIILFSGSNMYQNRIALNDIVSKIMKNIIREYKCAKLLVVGTIGKYLEKIRHIISPLSNHLIRTGFVEDIVPYYSIADAVIIPLRYGTGTKLKILEAMAAGKVIISTSNGAKGIDFEDQKSIIIEDDFEKFAFHIKNVLEDNKCRKNMEKSARKMSLIYDWNQLFKKYEDVYKKFS